MAQLAFSFDNNVTPISEHGARIGRRYPKISDDPGKRLGLQGGDQNRGVGIDYFTNAAARMGWGTPSLTEATEYDLVRLSYNYWLLITLYRNHWISRRIIDVPAQDMVRAWPKITSDIDPKDLTKIDQAIRRTNTKSNILKTLKWARLFGGAGALIVIDGQEDMLEEPLDIDSVGIGAFRGIIPFDRWAGITNSGDVSTDITKPLEFNLPEWYDVQAPNGAEHFRVHSSRILRFCGPSVPTPEYEAQQYWGISALEIAFEEIRKRDNMSQNILNLTFRANIIGMKYPELAQALSGLGMNQNALIQFQARMQAVNELMSNQSLMMLPKDGEMSSTNYSFTGMADVYQQFQLDIAGAAQIPVTRLFGRTLTGLGQSNDADEKIYEEFISLEQNDQMLPQLDRLYPVICMSTIGQVPDDLDLLFPSVRVLDHKERAELAKAIGDNIVSLFGAGIINRPQALKEIKQSSDITEIGTNITDEEIEEAETQEKVAPTLQLEQPDDEDEGDDKDKSSAKDSWNESEHPRVGSGPTGGQFTSGGGGGGGTATAPAKSTKIPTSEFSLSSHQKAIEHRFNKQIEADPEGMIQEYKQKFGNVLNADNAKELSPDYLKNRAAAAPAVHEGASWLVKQMYKEQLEKPAPPGKENTVLFTAGGAGVGKTSAVEGSAQGKAMMDRAQLVFDGTLRPANSAAAKFEQALKAGKKAVVLFVYRDPVEAFENGVLGRAARQEEKFGSGRTVPIGEFVAQHTSVDKSMAHLEEKFGDDPNFELGVIDNSHGPGGARSSKLHHLPTPPDPKELHAKLKEKLDEAYKSGRISKTIYEATLSGEGNKEVGM